MTTLNPLTTDYFSSTSPQLDNDDENDAERGSSTLKDDSIFPQSSLIETFSRVSVLNVLIPDIDQIENEDVPNQSRQSSKGQSQLLKYVKRSFFLLYFPALIFFFYESSSQCTNMNTLTYLFLMFLLFYAFPLIVIFLSPLFYPIFRTVNSFLEKQSQREKEKVHSLVDCFSSFSEYDSGRKAKRIISTINLILTLVLFLLIDLVVFVYGLSLWWTDNSCSSSKQVEVFFLFTLSIQSLFTLLPCAYILLHYLLKLLRRRLEITKKKFSAQAIALSDKITSHSWEEVEGLISEASCRLFLPHRHIALSLALSQSEVPEHIIAQILLCCPDSLQFVFEYSWYVNLTMLEMALQHNLSSKIVEMLIVHRALLYPPHVFWAIQMKTRPTTIAILLDHCPSVFFAKGPQGTTILHQLLRQALYDEQSEYVLQELSAANQFDALGNLPIHYALQRKANISLIRRLVSLFPEGLDCANQEKKRPFQMLFSRPPLSQQKGEEEALVLMGRGGEAGEEAGEESLDFDYLLQLLGLFNEMKQLSATWMWIIEGGNPQFSLSFQKRLTERLLQRYRAALHDFIYATDSNGRQAVRIAAKEVVSIMESFLLFCGRFEIQKDLALHRSETSVIYSANDYFDPQQTCEETLLIDSSSSCFTETAGAKEERETLLSSGSPLALATGGRRGKMGKTFRSLISIGQSQKVILKFMRNNHQFHRELMIRRELLLSGPSSNNNRTTISSNNNSASSYPFIETLEAYDRYRDVEFAEDLQQLGPAFESIHYCIAMPAAEKNLKTILDSEAIAGKEEATIYEIAKQIAAGLDFLHSRGVMHGDLKPLNIVRSAGLRYKLIDFDASVRFAPETSRGFCGSKWSSAYLPPEMLWREGRTGRVAVREIPEELLQKMYAKEEEKETIGLKEDSLLLPYELLPASPAVDLWSFGCILYQLFANEVLWKANGNDNLNEEELEKLYSWNDEQEKEKTALSWKRRLLAPLQSRPRHYYLLDHLLSSASKGYRSSVAAIMQHAYFHPGKTSIRMPGEEYQHHVFISYRVASDAMHALSLYRFLEKLKVLVWLDQKNILPGEDWKESFCRGLIQAKVFIPIISRKALIPSFSQLTSTSPCDNVLLEYRLALELKQRGYLEKICPIFLGDESSSTTSTTNNKNGSQFSDYFTSGCEPTCPNVVVESIEESAGEILEKYCFGPSFLPNLTVRQTFQEIKKSQGCKIVGEGTFEELLQKLGKQLPEQILR